jgi:hypothetical protein
VEEKIRFMDVLEAHARNEIRKSTNELKKIAAKEIHNVATDLLQNLLFGKERGKKGGSPFDAFFSAGSRMRDTHKAQLIKRIVAGTKADWKASRERPSSRETASEARVGTHGINAAPWQLCASRRFISSRILGQDRPSSKSPFLISMESYRDFMNTRHLCTSSQRPLARSSAAFTFIENIFALALVAISFVALFSLNAQCLYMLNSGRGAVFATQSLQDRAEQLRNCTWSQLTDASYIQSSVLNSSTNGIQNLGQVTETVTVNAYPTALNPPNSVVRSNGSPSTVSSNAAIANGDMVRVDIVLAWTRLGNRARTKAMTTVIAKNTP